MREPYVHNQFGKYAHLDNEGDDRNQGLSEANGRFVLAACLIATGAFLLGCATLIAIAWIVWG